MTRRQNAKEIRDRATQFAHDREHHEHVSNVDEQRYASSSFAMSFTKGLSHCQETGLISRDKDFVDFRDAIKKGKVDEFTTSVTPSLEKVRKWEAPTAGYVYSLQGPDSHAVTMPPAPALGSKELAYEMAEVYELALLRDEPLADFTEGANNRELQASLGRLSRIGYDLNGSEGRKRTTNSEGEIDAQTVFRGSSRGVNVGPYLSQFMLIGNKSVANEGEVADGIIRYGALEIDQRVPIAKEGVDFMTNWEEWLSVQNGADPQKGKEEELFGRPRRVKRRFITTPRDLATYVHYDALYQAYLNACLILLGMKAPFDPKFDKLSGQGKHIDGNGVEHERQAGGFALWGGPHILTLVTEVATRALKAVRHQKFNVHRRLRPEALAGRIEKADAISARFPETGQALKDLEAMIQETVNAIAERNDSGTKLLPMAFQEGSPMHPSYGAGHATVAGACVTILKAFFDTNAKLVKRGDEVLFAQEVMEGDVPVAYVPNGSGNRLIEKCDGEYLTLEGELNKLAANISIGRNMAGVHYYSDYFDSVRMGEKIAIQILEEQGFCYENDEFEMSLRRFDDEPYPIGKPVVEMHA